MQVPSADLGVVAPHSERTLAAVTRMNVRLETREQTTVVIQMMRNGFWRARIRPAPLW